MSAANRPMRTSALRGRYATSPATRPSAGIDDAASAVAAEPKSASTKTGTASRFAGSETSEMRPKRAGDHRQHGEARGGGNRQRSPRGSVASQPGRTRQPRQKQRPQAAATARTMPSVAAKLSWNDTSSIEQGLRGDKQGRGEHDRRQGAARPPGKHGAEHDGRHDGCAQDGGRGADEDRVDQRRRPSRRPLRGGGRSARPARPTTKPATRMTF